MSFKLYCYIRVAEVGRLSANAKNAFNSFVGCVFANSRQKGSFLPSFTQFYRVLPSFTQFLLVLPSFYLGLPSFTQFYLVLPSFTQLYLVFTRQGLKLFLAANKSISIMNPLLPASICKHFAINDCCDNHMIIRQEQNHLKNITKYNTLCENVDILDSS